MTVIRVEELVGGSRTEFGVPIFWQVEAANGSPVRTVSVGETPAGFVETVPLSQPLPTDEHLGIEGTRSGMGMSFRIDSLEQGNVLRGTYDSVDAEQFESDAQRECSITRATAVISALLIPLAFLGLAILLRRLQRGRGSWLKREVQTISATFGLATYVAVVASGTSNYELGLDALVAGPLAGAVGGAIIALALAPILIGVAALLERAHRRRHGGYRVILLLAIFVLGLVLFGRLGVPLIWWTMVVDGITA